MTIGERLTLRAGKKNERSCQGRRKQEKESEKAARRETRRNTITKMSVSSPIKFLFKLREQRNCKSFIHFLAIKRHKKSKTEMVKDEI